MCESGDPSSVGEALGMLDAALDFLNRTSPGSLPASTQAEALRALERAEARHTAARAEFLTAFSARNGYEDDGQGSARAWLRWQTRITRGAAAGAVGWAKRLAAHPLIREELAGGAISASWAREICRWSERLPEAKREDADQILLDAARGGADLAGLAGLAEEMYERSRRHSPDDGPGDGFDDRGVWLGITFGGAARLNGDLTPGCASALLAVLEALGKKAGPEDMRTAAHRRHDALEDACRRLIAAGMLPARAGQPAQAQVHITLSQLRDLPGASDAEAAWLAARGEQAGWLTKPEAAAALCDAAVVPIVAGHVDQVALDRMTGLFLATHGLRPDGSARCGCTCGGCACSRHAPLPPGTLARLRRALLSAAVDAVSGPGGLASWLRRSQLTGGPGASRSDPLGISLPLDSGQAEPTIPAHLRRAVMTRHRHCAFPGCETPASICQVHHLVSRAQGGPTALHNLAPLCTFHHLVVIHRWGWTLTLHPDGATSASSPDGRTLRSHGPPAEAA